MRGLVVFMIAGLLASGLKGCAGISDDERAVLEIQRAIDGDDAVRFRAALVANPRVAREPPLRAAVYAFEDMPLGSRLGAIALHDGTEFIQAWIDAGAPIDETDASSMSMLVYAVGSKDHERVRWLLERGASPNAFVTGTIAAWPYALSNEVACSLLLDHGAVLDRRGDLYALVGDEVCLACFVAYLECFDQCCDPKVRAEMERLLLLKPAPADYVAMLEYLACKCTPDE